MRFNRLAGLIVLTCAVSSLYAQKSPVRKSQFVQWRAAIRKTLFIPRSLPALRVEDHGRFSPAPGVVADRVLFSTTYGMQVAAIYYHPAHPKGKIPAYVVINGHGNDKYSWYSSYTGILFAQGGAGVLTYDALGEGESNIDRKSHTRAHDRVINIPNMPSQLTGFMVADVLQAVSFLEQRSEVDHTRINLLGHSMGTYIGALAGAIDTRIDAVVLSAGGTLDGPKGYWDSGKVMCQGGSYTALIPMLGDRPAVIYALNQQHGPMFIMNGTADRLIVKPDVHQPFFDDLHKRVVALTGTEKNIFENYWVQDAGHRPSWMSLPGMLWISDHVGFPEWTRQQLIDMPTTHMADWFKANHADVEAEYLPEASEAGIQALGNNIPALARTDLNVLTDNEWQLKKGSLIYETWLIRALAAEHITGAAAEKVLAENPPAR